MQAKQNSEKTLGLYIHVPFCATTCDFCAFHQEAPTRQALDDYLVALERELALAELPGRVETVFFGGGTPGLLSIEDFERIFQALQEYTDFRPEEITVECAPSTVKPAKAWALRELGVTRVSLGVQSFNEKLLKKLGRRQSVRQARRAFEILREAGFDNINIDLMFAYPGQKPAAWAKDLVEAVALGPEHISTYCLTFEEDTALWVELTEGGLKRDIDHEATLYSMTWDFMETAGYDQYEISNFARPGYECQHNLNTWQMGHWRGIGPSAASQFGGWRFANPADTSKWQKALAQAKAPVSVPPPWAVERVSLDEEMLFCDAVSFGLRMNRGISILELKARWPSEADVAAGLEGFLEKLIEEGLALKKDDRLALTPEGMLVVDAVGAELIPSCDF